LAVSSEQSLDRKLFVQFISLIFLTFLTRKMHENNFFKDHTLQDILDELDTIECFDIPGRYLLVGEITNRQMDLYSNLGCRPPASLQ
jgi:hypothetical protein